MKKNKKNDRMGTTAKKMESDEKGNGESCQNIEHATTLRMKSLVSDVGLKIRGKAPQWFASTVYDATYEIMPGACINQLRCKKFYHTSSFDVRVW